ncbi:acyl-CoA/acyl-ACP dehydrogenase [Phenylobacterium sp. LjRoot225]|uniref:acyl-CoA dehydrogenase family protein n=1 Tax=Phenylobacterium sp. LjRoot225 TaxID=3342285 RepID=UPI003ED03C73
MNLPFALRRRGADLEDILPGLTAAFAATAAAHDRDSSFPFENFTQLHETGLLALTAPTAFGGGGADLATTLRVIEAVARGEPATALVLAMQYIFHAALPEWPGVPDHLKTNLVRDAVERGALINALHVEPELGTPARGGLPATVARRTVDGWRLSGRKIYATGAPALSWMLVWARTDEAAPRVGNFLVPREAPGWRIEESWDHTGLRARASHDVIFEDTPLLDQYALAPRPAGASPPALDPVMAVWAPVLTAGIYHAVAVAARDWFVRCTVDRRPANLGASLSTLPRFQELAGAIDGLLLQNRTLLDAAAAGRLAPDQGGLVKHLVTENAIAAVEKAIAATGNPGLSRHNDLQRHYRDVLCGRVHTPQADVALAAAGKAAFAALG